MLILKVILFCVYVSARLSTSDGGLILQKNVSVSAVFVFGDSFADQGNNNYINTLAKGNFPPYGMDFLDAKPTGRFSNGKTLSDFLVEALGVKDHLPPSLDPLLEDKDLQTGVSFGSAASGFDPLTSTITSTIPMLAQLKMFKEYIVALKKNIGEERANDIITNSVLVILAGNNDLIISRRLHHDVLDYSNMVVKLLLNLLQEIYTLGVRRIVVFSAPPIGCFPDVRTLIGGPERRCVNEENNVAQMFNSIVEQHLQFWRTSFPESRVAYIDYYSPLINIIENPQKYGFDVADKGCCGTGEIEVTFLCNKLTSTCPDRSKYFFWDSFHLTEKGNSVVVNHILQDMVNGLF